MSEQNFERASQIKLRFVTAKGLLSTEDLWDLSLDRGAVTLDSIALDYYTQLKTENISFVNNEKNVNSLNQLRFDIVKYVIDVKLAEREKAKTAADNKIKKNRILELIAQKQDEAFSTKSVEELNAMLADL